jgi:CBS domain-containing protein
MLVSTILQAKGRAVTTVASSASLMEAARSLASRRIGAVVIVDADNRVAGILSERDIVRAVARSGPAALDAPCGEVMTRAVVTCQDHDTIDHLMQEMTKGRFRHLPVVDVAGRLTGIVSIGDVVKFHVQEIESDANAMRQYITHATQ